MWFSLVWPELPLPNPVFQAQAFPDFLLCQPLQFLNIPDISQGPSQRPIFLLGVPVQVTHFRQHRLLAVA
jgi:hypothetical protein